MKNMTLLHFIMILIGSVTTPTQNLSRAKASALWRVSLIAGLDSPLECGTGTWDWNVRILKLLVLHKYSIDSTRRYSSLPRLEKNSYRYAIAAHLWPMLIWLLPVQQYKRGWLFSRSCGRDGNHQQSTRHDVDRPLSLLRLSNTQTFTSLHTDESLLFHILTWYAHVAGSKLTRSLVPRHESESEDGVHVWEQDCESA